jgi:two-component system, NarL family, nitrate/nitrite response regulator NarL
MAAAAERVTVLVADDHPVFLEAVIRAVRERSDFELVGRAGDGREGLDEIRRSQPRVAVIDQQLPSLDGIGILQAVQRDALPTRVLILSSDDSSALVYEAVRLGVAGFLTKAATLAVAGFLTKAATLAGICDAIVAVSRGTTVLAPEVQTGVPDELRAHDRKEASILTTRESEVLRLIAEGLSTPEIGNRLFISASTVKTHVQRLFEKLGVSDRAAAVAEGMRRGLLE